MNECAREGANSMTVTSSTYHKGLEVFGVTIDTGNRDARPRGNHKFGSCEGARSATRGDLVGKRRKAEVRRVKVGSEEVGKRPKHVSGTRILEGKEKYKGIGMKSLPGVGRICPMHPVSPFRRILRGPSA